MLESVMDFFLSLPTYGQIIVGVLAFFLILSIFKKFLKFAILLAVLIVLVIVVLKALYIIN